MELIIKDVDISKHKLTPEIETELIADVPKKWDTWNDNRKKQLDCIDEVKKHIDFSKITKDGLGGKLPDVKEIGDTYISHIANSLLKSPDALFSVSPVSVDTSNISSTIQGLAGQIMPQGNDESGMKHKKMIIEQLEKTKYEKVFKKAIENYTYKGEFIVLTDWQIKTKRVRRKVKNGNTSVFGTFEIPTYEGISLKVIEPEKIVFDVSKDDFEESFKIYREFYHYSDISANKIYSETLGKEKLQELKDLSTVKTDSTSNKELLKDENKGVDEKGRLEVLECWGDITIDGEFYPNSLIVIIARKFVARFEYNPYIICPITYLGCEYDEETGRHLPKVMPLLYINEKASETMDLMIQALKLIINKPYLAPKGSLSGKISIKEGSIIEYDPALMPKAPEALDFKDALVGWNFLTFFEKKLEEVSGVSKYATGDSGTKPRTAREAMQIVSGQNIRLGDDVAEIGNFGILPVVEKIAEMLANIEPDLQITNMPELDNIVRQGMYEYKLSNSQASIEKKAKMQEASEAVKMLWQDVPFKAEKWWEYIASALEFENPSDFIEQDQLNLALEKIPPEQKEPIKAKLMEFLQQMQMQG